MTPLIAHGVGCDGRGEKILFFFRRLCYDDTDRRVLRGD